MTTTSATEPNEARLIDSAIAELARTSGVPVAFGGPTIEGTVAITGIVGARTRALDGLTVSPRLGLGGRALVDTAPHATSDYGASRSITHDYDRHILGEGIAALVAVPVVVAGRARGMLYGGSRLRGTIEGRFSAAALAIAARLSREIAERDERLARTRSVPASALEELRGAYAELRRITRTVEDGGLRARLVAVERRIAAVGGVDATNDQHDRLDSDATVSLSPREHDVLCFAALGFTNPEVAARLGLRESTVKSYLASAMAKLDASTRLGAVSAARRRGLIP
jgi:DNA-binding CsgD family transcriptional regulator